MATPEKGEKQTCQDQAVPQCNEEQYRSLARAHLSSSESRIERSALSRGLGH